MFVVNSKPLVSVIIPTHNRNTTLQRTLTALAAQAFPHQDMEVLVVADGCTDGTTEKLRHFRKPFALQVIEQAELGAAAARNRGAEHATGRLLLFLDDDIEASPSLVEAHVCAHQKGSDQVVIGYVPPVVLSGRMDFFNIDRRDWWESKFYAMRQHGYRYAYSDLLSGNFSLKAELFARVGGFDPSFRCREDYELGMRLIKARADFCFVVDALGYHHEATDLDHSLKRKYEEGKADVLMGRRHPELRPLLPLASLKPHSLPGHIPRVLAFRCPAAIKAITVIVQQALDLLEWVRMRKLWGRLRGGLYTYWYWRGVAEKLGTRSAVRIFLQSSPDHPHEEGCDIEIDLYKGLEAAEGRLDRERPASIRILFGQHFVGCIPPQPGAELLRGAHLRPILSTRMAQPMLIALAMEGVLGTALEMKRPPAGSPREHSKYGGRAFVER